MCVLSYFPYYSPLHILAILAVFSFGFLAGFAVRALTDRAAHPNRRDDEATALPIQNESVRGASSAAGLPKPRGFHGLNTQ